MTDYEAPTPTEFTTDTPQHWTHEETGCEIYFGGEITGYVATDPTGEPLIPETGIGHGSLGDAKDTVRRYADLLVAELHGDGPEDPQDKDPSYLRHQADSLQEELDRGPVADAENGPSPDDWMDTGMLEREIHDLRARADQLDREAL